MSNLPTVCFLTGTLNAFAGAERMTAVIANALAERGYRVFVLSLWDRASVFPLHEGVEHHALFEQRPSFKRAYFSTVLGIRRFVRKHGIDVLIEVDTMLTLFTQPATLGMKVRRIAWEHCHFDEDLGRKARRVARWLAGRFDDAVVVLTERDRANWLKLGARGENIVAIGNALPFAFPSVLSSSDNRTLLAVGRLTHAKGFDTLLRAWHGASSDLPDWRLRIVGEGEERPTLEALCNELGVSTTVELPGVTDDIESEYRRASAFCLSSRYEGFGLVLIEAMAYGLPIVATDCETGPKAILEHAGVASVVPIDNAPALAAAIVKTCSDSAYGAALSEAGRVVAARYGVTEIVAQWIALLNPTNRPPEPAAVTQGPPEHN